MRLYEIFKEPKEDDINNFVANPVNFNIELEYLDDLFNDNNYYLILFYITVLFRVKKKQEMVISVILKHIEKYVNYRDCLFLLNILNMLNDSIHLTPIHFYTIKIFKIITEQTPSNYKNKNFTLEDVELTNDDLKMESLRDFARDQAQLLILNILSKYSNNIGFPELGNSIIKSMQTFIVKFDKNIINKIEERINFITENRKIYLAEKNDKKVYNFEKDIKKVQF